MELSLVMPSCSTVEYFRNYMMGEFKQSVAVDYIESLYGSSTDGPSLFSMTFPGEYKQITARELDPYMIAGLAFTVVKTVQSTQSTPVEAIVSVVEFVAKRFEYFNVPDLVEEKIGEQNFRLFGEMRILSKIRVVILDFLGYVEILAKCFAKSGFRF